MATPHGALEAAMRFAMMRDRIRVIPETQQDVAYIEDTLGMRSSRAIIELRRYDSIPSDEGYMAMAEQQRNLGRCMCLETAPLPPVASDENVSGR